MSVDEPQSAVSASSAMPHHLTGPIMEEEATPAGLQHKQQQAVHECFCCMTSFGRRLSGQCQLRGANCAAEPQCSVTVSAARMPKWHEQAMALCRVKLGNDVSLTVCQKVDEHVFEQVAATGAGASFSMSACMLQNEVFAPQKHCKLTNLWSL